MELFGPTYEFVRLDILNRLTNILKIKKKSVLENTIKNIINKHIPETKSIIKYGNWNYYKKFGVDKNLKANILLEIFIKCHHKLLNLKKN